MKQTKISYWLKGLVIVLAAMGILFFGGLTYYVIYMEYSGLVVFVWYTAAFCYVILIEFWRVCTQIGKDNSFSMENTRAFHRMGLCGIAEAAGFAVRLLWLSVCGITTFPVAIFIIAEIILSLIFFILCEALSRLVQNAYEVKLENELTI